MQDSIDPGTPHHQPHLPALFPPAAPAALPALRLHFSASGSEYFRIWIVNLLLSLLTLGIYAAWAKVRRLRYFYGNTRLAGSSFDYHGNPIAILKGRVIAVVLLALYHGAFGIDPTLGMASVLLIGLAAPWLIWRSLQFKLYNSSYRGIRFGFAGSTGGAYASFLLYPLLAVATAGLLVPLAHQRIKRFQHNQSRFGSSHFSFHGSVARFYLAYLLGIGIWLAGLALILAGFTGTIMALASGSFGVARMLSGMLLLLSVYTWTWLSLPLFLTLLQNLIWNHTRLGEHRFSSHMRWGRMMFISLTNVLGILCTLGLYTPFAKVRMLRYRIESLRLLPASALDEFIAATEAAGSTTGEGMSDLLDFDLSL